MELCKIGADGNAGSGDTWDMLACDGSGDSFSHSFISTFFVFGNLKPGANGPTAAATSRQADDNGVDGVELWELLLAPLSHVGLLTGVGCCNGGELGGPGAFEFAKAKSKPAAVGIPWCPADEDPVLLAPSIIVVFFPGVCKCDE